MRQKRKKSRGGKENPLEQFPNVCDKITNLTREFTYGNTPGRQWKKRQIRNYAIFFSYIYPGYMLSISRGGQFEPRGYTLFSPLSIT